MSYAEYLAANGKMTDHWTPEGLAIREALAWIDDIYWGNDQLSEVIDGERATEDYLDLAPISPAELAAIAASINVWLALMGSLITIVSDGQFLRIRRPSRLLANLVESAKGAL